MRPEEYRPRFSHITYSHDSFDWHTGFLLGTEFAPRLWNPVIRGHAVTGDIIAPIRALCDAQNITPPAEIIQIAAAVIKIRDYLMPRNLRLTCYCT